MRKKCDLKEGIRKEERERKGIWERGEGKRLEIKKIRKRRKEIWEKGIWEWEEREKEENICFKK